MTAGFISGFRGNEIRVALILAFSHGEKESCLFLSQTFSVALTGAARTASDPDSQDTRGLCPFLRGERKRYNAPFDFVSSPTGRGLR